MPEDFWQHFGLEIKNWRRAVNTKTEQTDLGFNALHHVLSSTSKGLRECESVHIVHSDASVCVCVCVRLWVCMHESGPFVYTYLFVY